MLVLTSTNINDLVLTSTNMNNLYYNILVVTNTCRRDDRAPRVSAIMI
jgi:hypothetical protein